MTPGEGRARGRAAAQRQAFVFTPTFATTPARSEDDMESTRSYNGDSRGDGDDDDDDDEDAVVVVRGAVASERRGRGRLSAASASTMPYQTTPRTRDRSRSRSKQTERVSAQRPASTPGRGILKKTASQPFEEKDGALTRVVETMVDFVGPVIKQALVLALLAWAVSIWHSGEFFRMEPLTPFCDSAPTSSAAVALPGSSPLPSCRPCDPFGVCKGGVMECRDGYRLVGHKCAEDEERKILASRMAEDELTLLLRRRLAGVECGEVPEGVSASMTGAELRAEHAREFPSIDLIKRGIFANVTKEAFENLDRWAPQLGVVVSKNSTYLASVPYRSLRCETKALLRAHAGPLACAAVLIALFFYIRHAISQRRQVQAASLRLWEEVKSRLAGRPDGINADQLEASLSDRYHGHLTATVFSKAWAKVCLTVARDPRVSELDQAGSRIWLWVADTDDLASPSIRNSSAFKRNIRIDEDSNQAQEYFKGDPPEETPKAHSSRRHLDL
jgi:hypothetical protein